MTEVATLPYSVRVIVRSYTFGSAQMPKLIEVFDSSLKVVIYQWYESNDIFVDHLPDGTYTLRLSMISGLQRDVMFEVHDGSADEIEMDIGDSSPRESQEWAYFNKSLTIDAVRGVNRETFNQRRQTAIFVDICLWNFYSAGKWRKDTSAHSQFQTQSIDLVGNDFIVDVAFEPTLLEVRTGARRSVFVSLPPGNICQCLIKRTEGEARNFGPVDVAVSTNNFKAEALITLLTNGAIDKARTLSDAKEAEKLLYEKQSNAPAAAIGGYFLLKTGELDRLHDWASNLADWFPWLADGPVIHATQLLSKREKSEHDISLIRARLLEAVGRGIPVYSEGLRLLEKGLTQLWYHFEESDAEINSARKKIGYYAATVDWNQETTTFRSGSPNVPARPRYFSNESY